MARTSTAASAKAKQGRKPTTRKTAVMRLRESRRLKRTRVTLSAPSITLFDKYSIAWMMTVIRMSGGIRHQTNPHTYLLVCNADGKAGPPVITWKVLSPAIQAALAEQLKAEILKRFKHLSNPMASLRQSTKAARKVAYGSKKSLHDQARFYLELIDHKEMEAFDTPLIVLAKTVCNLRNYYAQTKDQTIELIRGRYNELSRIHWSAEAIALIWDLVEVYVPSLWLQDERYLSERRRSELQRELNEVLKRLTPGGRIKVTDMQELVKQWDPNLDASPKALGDAMRAVTGSASTSSNSVAYYFGFQLPFRDDPAFEG